MAGDKGVARRSRETGERRGTIHPDGNRDKLLSQITPIFYDDEGVSHPDGYRGKRLSPTAQIKEWGTGVGWDGQDGQNGQDGQGQGLGHVKKRGFLQGILSKMDKIS